MYIPTVMQQSQDLGVLGIESEDFTLMEKFAAGFLSGQIYAGAFEHANGLSARNGRPLLDNFMGILGSHVAEMNYDDPRCAPIIDSFLENFRDYWAKWGNGAPPINGFLEMLARAFTPPDAADRIRGDRINLVARSSICAVAQRVYYAITKAPGLCQRICERDKSVLAELQQMVASKCVERRIEVSALFSQKMAGVRSSEYAQVADEIQIARKQLKACQKELEEARDTEERLRSDNRRMRDIIKKLLKTAEDATARESSLASEIMEMRSARSSMLDTMRRWQRSYDTSTIVPDDSASQAPPREMVSREPPRKPSEPPETVETIPEEPPKTVEAATPEVTKAPRVELDPKPKKTKKSKEIETKKLTVNSVLEDFDTVVSGDFEEHFGGGV